MLILSPIFPSLLTFILFTVYKIIFDSATLCDDGCPPLLLDQLKQNLAEEMGKSSRITHNITEFNKIIQEIEQPSLQKAYNYNRLNHWQEMLIKSLNRTKEIEADIKKIDPSFRSGCENINAGILRLLEQNRR